MLDQNAFRETLHLVQEVAAASDQPMTREEALSYFQDMELSEEQQELVFQFLQRPPEPEKEADDSGTAAGQARGAGISRPLQDQEQQLYQRLLAGDKSVIEEISHLWLSRIAAIAREYQNGSDYLEDLVQEGNMALLMALHGFAGRQETQELEKQLVEAVMDAIEAFIGQEAGVRQQAETILAKVSLLHEARKLLMDQSGEEPTMDELADYTRLTRQEIDDIMDLMEKAKKSS